MLKEWYSFEDLKMSSKLVRDMVAESPSVEPLVGRFFDLEKIREQVKDKELSEEVRQDLVAALHNQNKGLDLSEKTQANIDLLKDQKTYTITTGHQLNLFTGPLYSIYKILEVIVLADSISNSNSEFSAVPVFWMATEDHDLDEINHVNLFGEKIEWDTSNQNGSISGKVDTKSIEVFLERIKEKFRDPSAIEIVEKFSEHYRKQDTLAAASRSLINELFGQFGLVIIDGDDPLLKKHFARAMQREVEEELTYEAVMKVNRYLEDNDYHQQVYVRDCNLFYIDAENKRSRIIKEEGAFLVDGKKFNAEELSELIIDQPASFSPNALLRPVYQETILPNLAYIGGGGEIAYWLQLEELFTFLELPMPMLRLRDSVLVYNSKQADLMKEFDISLMDIKLGIDQLVKDIAINQSESDLQLTEAQSTLFQVKSKVIEKVHQVNPSMEQMVDAEFAKMIKGLEKIEGKLIKAEKQKHEQTQKKLSKVQDQFFPNGGFQERYDNLLSYITKDQDFIQKILATLKAETTPKVRTIEL